MPQNTFPMAETGQLSNLIKRAHAEGAQEIDEAAQATDRFSAAQARAAESLRQIIAPYEAVMRLTNAQSAAQKQWQQRETAYKNSPAYARAEAMRQSVQAARPRDASGRFSRFLDERLGRYTPPENRFAPPPSKSAAALETFLSSRFGGGRGGNGGGGMGGGLLSLLGGEAGGAAGLEGLAAGAGPVGAAVAGVAAVGKAGMEVAKKMYEFAAESARVTQAFSDLRERTGGRSIDAARATILSRITGVEGGAAARAFNDRITSDRLAMAYASRFGVYNIPGPYGKRNFGERYQQAVQRVSAIQDAESRGRVADQLGIGTEVSRYRFLGGDARHRMDRISRTTALINNPEAERRAAQLQAAIENEAQARENLKTAFGQSFGGGFVKLLNTLADGENNVARGLFETNKWFDRYRIGPDKQYGNRVERAVREMDTRDGGGAFSGGSGGGGFADAGGSTVRASNNNMALLLMGQLINSNKELNGTILKLIGVYGGGERGKEAVPAALVSNPVAISQAVHSRALNLGPL